MAVAFDTGYVSLETVAAYIRLIGQEVKNRIGKQPDSAYNTEIVSGDALAEIGIGDIDAHYIEIA